MESAESVALAELVESAASAVSVVPAELAGPAEATVCQPCQPVAIAATGNTIRSIVAALPTATGRPPIGSEALPGVILLPIVSPVLDNRLGVRAAIWRVIAALEQDSAIEAELGALVAGLREADRTALAAAISPAAAEETATLSAAVPGDHGVTTDRTPDRVVAAAPPA